MPEKPELHLRSVQRVRYEPEGSAAREDLLAVEEPLEIRLAYRRDGVLVQQSVSVTMRTPGEDFDLALGFLFTEGIIASAGAVVGVSYCGEPQTGRENSNVVRVEIQGPPPDLGRLQRNFYTTSSCGVCGKTSLEALEVVGHEKILGGLRVPAGWLLELPRRLRQAQPSFGATGGMHAAGAFSPNEATEAIVREDVGRHNALDKVVGHALGTGRLPLRESVIMLSGRGSFELLQKSLAARASVVAAVGPPSSLAVELAEEFGITLVGFLRGDTFNVYSHPERIVS